MHTSNFHQAFGTTRFRLLVAISCFFMALFAASPSKAEDWPDH